MASASPVRPGTGSVVKINDVAASLIRLNSFESTSSVYASRAATGGTAFASAVTAGIVAVKANL